MRLWLVLFGVTSFVVGGVGFVKRHAHEWRAAQRQTEWGHRIVPGDLVFQDVDDDRERTGAIDDRYRGVGIVLDEEGELMVWDAAGPRRPTPLADWMRRGVHEDVAVYRLLPRFASRLPQIAQRVRVRPGAIAGARFIAEALRGGLAIPDLVEDASVTPRALIESGVFLRVVDELADPRDERQSWSPLPLASPGARCLPPLRVSRARCIAAERAADAIEKSWLVAFQRIGDGGDPGWTANQIEAIERAGSYADVIWRRLAISRAPGARAAAAVALRRRNAPWARALWRQLARDPEPVQAAEGCTQSMRPVAWYAVEDSEVSPL